jgi:hypothetical protein
MAVEFSLPRGITFNTSQSEPGVQARSIVDERFDVVSAFVNSAKAEFDNALEEMQSALSPIAVGEIEASGIVVPELGADIPAFTATFDATFDASIRDFTVEYVEPEGKPIGTMPEWEEGEVELRVPFVEAVVGWLTSESSAVPASVEAQIYDAAITRLSEEFNSAVLDYESSVSDRGFEVPTGVADARLLQLNGEYIKGAADLSARLAEKNIELTQQNKHKAGELAVQYIGIAQDYIVARNTARLTFYKGQFETWIAQVEAAVKIVEAKVSAFLGEVEAYKAQAAVYQSQASVYETEVRAYIGTVEGIKARISAIAESIKMQVSVFEVETRAAIEEEKLKVEAQIATNNLVERIAEARGNLQAQIVASGLSALHVQASISSSHNTGQSVGFSYSYGEQLSEQHSESQSISITAET